MAFTGRCLSPQESGIVLALSEHGRRETTRAEIVELLGVTPKAADQVIEWLCRKGRFERATWGEQLPFSTQAGTGRPGR
jgi:predicted ArsR family transcriptional regulator